MNPKLQRLAPDPVAVWLTVLFTRVLWHFDRDRREAAIRNISKLLADTPLSGEVNRHAHSHLAENALRELVIWRPWMYAKAQLIDEQNLIRASAAGKGVILMTAHIGANSIGQLAIKLGRGDHRLNIFTGPWLDVADYVGYGGHRALTIKRRAERNGGHWITSPGAFKVLAERMGNNELATIPFDVCGDHETTFMGRRAWMRTACRAWPSPRAPRSSRPTPAARAPASTSASASRSTRPASTASTT